MPGGIGKGAASAIRSGGKAIAGAIEAGGAAVVKGITKVGDTAAAAVAPPPPEPKKKPTPAATGGATGGTASSDKQATDKQATGKQEAAFKEPAGSAKGSESALISAAKAGGITDPIELAQFLAQASVESMNFKTLREIGGPSYFAKYDGRKDIGNSEPGDGYKYKGRGYLQITGRANYEKYGKIVNADLVNNPVLAESPDIGAKISVAYWNSRVKRRVKDFNDTERVTQIINGGHNGLAQRKANFAKYSKGISTTGEKENSASIGTKPKAEGPAGNMAVDSKASISSTKAKSGSGNAPSATSAESTKDGTPKSEASTKKTATPSIKSASISAPKPVASTPTPVPVAPSASAPPSMQAAMAPQATSTSPKKSTNKPSTKKKSIQFGVPSPEHRYIEADFTSVFFNVGDPHMGVSMGT